MRNSERIEMIATAFAARIAVVALLVEPALSQQLQWRYNSSNAHWYGIPFAPRNWSAGEALALSQTGHLATIRNSAENSWLGTTFTGFNSSGFWIGFNDVAVEGAFAWTSGEPTTFTNWNAGEPNNSGDQDATRLIAASPWRWDDAQTSLTTFTPIVELPDRPHEGWSLPNSYVVQLQPGAFAVADWNGDGWLDLAAPNRGSNTVSMLFGTSAGDFLPAQNFATRAGPVSVAAADFNHDGHLDLAVACSTAQQVRIYFGDGTGALFGVATLGTVGRPSQLVARDFDGDLAPDLAVTTTTPLDLLLVYRNIGVAAFDPPVAYATGVRPVHMTAADVDEDSDVDLVVACFDSDEIAIYQNGGIGNFTNLGTAPRGNGPAHIAVADLDGDGHVDLAIPNQPDGVVAVWWGNGDGTFGPGISLPVGTQPAWAAADDLDGDGRQDLVLANSGNGSATIYYGRGLGAFDGPYDLFAGVGAACVVPADFDRDGVLDLSLTLSPAGTGGSRAVVLQHIYRDCNANGRIDATDIRLGASIDANANQTPDECEAAGSAYCFGDGTGIACPCGPGQSGPIGHGCANSAGAAGLLAANGIASVALDSVTLAATGLLPNSAGLFFQGDAQQGGGLGALFGDGLVCAGTSVIRLVVRTASGGAMSFGDSVTGDPSVSQSGFVPPGGATRFYQVWYRDAATFCTASTFNLTNGVRIAWLP